MSSDGLDQVRAFLERVGIDTRNLPPPKIRTPSANMPAVPEKFHLIVTPEGADVWEFEKLDQLLEKLRELQAEESKTPMRSKAFIIAGKRMFLTRGPFKYLVLPSGQLVPIFVEPDKIEPDPAGYLVDPDKPLDAVDPEAPKRLPDSEEPDLAELMDSDEEWK